MVATIGSELRPAGMLTTLLLLDFAAVDGAARRENAVAELIQTAEVYTLVGSMRKRPTPVSQQLLLWSQQ